MTNFQQHYRQLGDRLYEILVSIPALADQDNRTHLLRHLPKEPVQLIKRSTAPATDWQNIITAIIGWGKFRSGELGLAVLTDSVGRIVKGTEHEAKLAAIRSDLKNLVLNMELDIDPAGRNRDLAVVKKIEAEKRSEIMGDDKGKVNIGSIGGDLSGNVSGGDILIEGGNVVGKNVNIGSVLKDVVQQTGALPLITADEQAELEQLLTQLQTELEKLPAAQQEEAETVAELTQDLVEEAGKEKPKKGKLEITGEGLKKAAQNLATVAPLIGEIVGNIVSKILNQAG